jgi:hypothetical protein
MALLFSFSVAMDEFVMGRVVTAIARIDDAAELVLHGGSFWAALH